MTDEQLVQFERSIDGMTSYNRAWVLNRDVAALIGEIKALKADNAQLTEALYAAHYKHKELADELDMYKNPGQHTWEDTW